MRRSRGCWTYYSGDDSDSCPHLRVHGAPGHAAIVPAETSARKEQQTPIIEDSATQKVALQFRYLTVTQRKEAVRHASVHRVVVGPLGRFVARCHRTGELKWFRIENVSARNSIRGIRFARRTRRPSAHLRASLDGFHEGGTPTKQVFFVSDPDAAWVARNLMDAMKCEEVPGGIRLTLETSAPKRLARFVPRHALLLRHPPQAGRSPSRPSTKLLGEGKMVYR
jgi:hypothetical protein